MPSIRSTVVPESYKPMTDRNFNNWINYVHGIKTKNTPKKGGAGFEEEQESLLDSAKEILTTNAKR